MTNQTLSLQEMLEQFDPSKHGGEFPDAKDAARYLATEPQPRKVFGLIERTADDSFQGRIIGFEHVTVTGPSTEVVRERLIAHAAQLIASGSLKLETHFESVVRLGEL